MTGNRPERQKKNVRVRNMKKLPFFILTAVLLLLVQGCYKTQYRSFIHNECGQSVTVSYTLGDVVHRYTLAYHQVVEIPDIERWDLITSPEQNVVRFEYADSTTVIHGCEHQIYADGTGEYIYTPAENNILLDDLSHTSWKSSNHPHNEIFKDYYIR